MVIGGRWVTRGTKPAYQRGHGAALTQSTTCCPPSLLLAVRPELLEIGPEVGNVLLVLDADECHAGAGHLLHRCLYIFMEHVLVPSDAGPLVGGRVVVALEAAGLATVDAVERRAKLDLGLGADLVAGHAQSPEHLLAGFRILRGARACRCGESNDRRCPDLHHPTSHSSSPFCIRRCRAPQVSARSWDLPETGYDLRASAKADVRKASANGVSNGVRRLQCQRPKVTISLAGPGADRAMVPGNANYA